MGLAAAQPQRSSTSSEVQMLDCLNDFDYSGCGSYSTIQFVVRKNECQQRPSRQGQDERGIRQTAEKRRHCGDTRIKAAAQRRRSFFIGTEGGSKDTKRKSHGDS